MDQPTLAALAQIDGIKEAMWQSVVYAAKEYANGNDRGKGIVDRHFTAGNQSRYGWPPLNRDYFLAKQRGIVGKVKRGVVQLGGGKTGSKIDKAAQFQSSTGTMTGIGSGANLPMLVRSGDLREAVNSKSHLIKEQRARGIVTVLFINLPGYATHLHEGTARMPKRSPVEPSPDDEFQVFEAARRKFSLLVGRGGNVPVSLTTIPGQARTS